MKQFQSLANFMIDVGQLTNNNPKLELNYLSPFSNCKILS